MASYRQLAAFVLASFLLIQVPTPSLLFTISRALAASTGAFTVLKLLGAAYVVYLGVQALGHRGVARGAPTAPPDSGRTTPWGPVRAGLLVGYTNPKTIIFFVAFLRGPPWPPPARTKT